ncbi:hypothetical protein SAMN05421810_103366 [Amycolatopsis arida]|uniref:Excreted virulence factor EspC, type VII ESX diderm n=1 Tax=Amycolatopsis arida TaxID=587909 RepID=A0A1I5T2G0_9PSEU|nr:hypothetical protein [Amycolatopsis arida]TDX96255.1 hypothetical protein CLV69_103392 [Amycolatopsis arida]SFP77213.1 hypothetical protein SAMN05421810_103366 [Amycolatopsis arida]
MPDFTVDIGGLDALGKDLDRTGENIDTATKRLADLGPEDLGPDVLDEACADFRDDWSGGLEELREAVEGIKGGLIEAKNAYAELEEALRQNLRKMADALVAEGNAR